MSVITGLFPVGTYHRACPDGGVLLHYPRGPSQPTYHRVYPDGGVLLHYNRVQKYPSTRINRVVRGFGVPSVVQKYPPTRASRGGKKVGESVLQRISTDPGEDKPQPQPTIGFTPMEEYFCTTPRFFGTHLPSGLSRWGCTSALQRTCPSNVLLLHYPCLVFHTGKTNHNALSTTSAQ